ncbi:hypothetical protein M7963_18535 [Enterobacter roggenkampii]|uniref:hypothetical protein n=1 Tax=Enterobacter roggenkampii TaxID=1812935 RepID=UPI0022376448|nr:hypothetical protein [Enterobacter roggenkampii]MCW5003516.1 hypothetical protein [Enterobacter roggenkampii]
MLNPRRISVVVAFVLSCFFSVAGHAGKYVPKDSTRMTGKVDRDGKTLVLSRKWNGIFTYSTANLNSYSRTVQLSNNHTVTLNIFPRMIAEEVIAIWQVTTFPFSSVQGNQPLSLAISTGRLPLPEQVGVTNPLGSPHTVTIDMDHIVNHAVRDYETSVSQGYINQGRTSFQDFVVMLTRLTLMHEIGHAMGLGHPNANTDPEQADYGGYFRVLIPADGSVPTPSIMVHDTRLYFQYLSQTLGRDVRPEDIRPSERDIRAANIMWSGLPQSTLISMSCTSRNGHCGIMWH